MLKLPNEKYYRLINHGPCVLIATGDGVTNNVAPVAWVTPVNDDPPLVGACIASSHYTAHLIRRFGCFVINVPGAELRDALIKAGSVSGRATDKIKACGLAVRAGVRVPTVHVDGCVGFIEARLHRAIPMHGVTLFVGAVVYCAVKRGVMRDGLLLPERARTLHHIGQKRFFVSTRAR